MDRKDVEVMTCCCKGNEDGNVKHGSLTVEYQEKYLQVL